MVLNMGFAGVSIEKLISALGMTKGAFFHHFKSKDDLARALIIRFADEGTQLFKDNLARAKKYSDDPYQQLLILISQYEEIFEGLTEPFPGCLLASYTYELHQFTEDTRDIINREFLLSRKEITKLLKQIMKQRPPAINIDPVSLADGFMSVFEGAFVLSKSLHESDITFQQLRHYKNYIQLIFQDD